MAVAMTETGSRINKLYFSSLVGSAFGSIIVLPLFFRLTGSGVIVFTSIIGGVSALIFALNLSRARTRLGIIGWILLLSLFLPFASNLFPVRISPYKSLMIALRYPEAQLLDTRWNAFSRVDVVKSGLVRYAPGLSLQFKGFIPEQVGVTIDGESLNAITRYNGSESSLSFTGFLPISLPYRLVHNPNVLIIDSGGGLSVLTALHHNASRVVAVEVNPIIVELIQKKYCEYSGSLYNNHKVQVVVDWGRGFIQSCDDEFDVIELSMTYSASASSAGNYALHENYMFTVESFKAFMFHLSENGFLSVSRLLLPPPREDVRIVSLAASALQDMGVSDPYEHIVVLRSWGTITLIVKKSPFKSEDLHAIEDFCEKMSFDIVYVPGVEPSEVNMYNIFPEPLFIGVCIIDKPDINPE